MYFKKSQISLLGRKDGKSIFNNYYQVTSDLTQACVAKCKEKCQCPINYLEMNHCKGFVY